MSRSGDNEFEMPPTGLLDDQTIERIVTGDDIDDVDARFESIVAFARQVRSVSDEPPPPPSPALEAVFAGQGRHFEVRRRWGRLTTAAAKVAGLGVVAKIGLGASVAVAGVAAAGAGGALPGPMTDGVRGAIEAVTPVDFGGPGSSDEPADQDDPDRFGDRVSRDATGESDGDPGVDGGEVSDEAPGAANRPSGAGSGSGDAPGLDRAGETPAGGNVPGSAGPGTDASDQSDDGTGPAGASDTPAATAPGGTAPGRTVQDPAAPTSTTVTLPSAPAPTVDRGSAGGGGSSTAPGG